MPDLSGNATAFRTTEHNARIFLSILHGQEVAEYNVSSAPDYASPVETVSVSLISGSASDVTEHQLIQVTNTAGTRTRGWLRVGTGGVSGGTLQVQEHSRNHAELGLNNRLHIYRSYPLTEKLVGADAEFTVDSRVSFSDETTAMRPLVRTGGHWVGFVDSGQSYASVTLDASNSENIDPASGSSQTYLWTLPTGVAFASGSTSADANPTVEITAGNALWIQCQVTDSSNSKSSTQYIAVRAHDESSNAPIEITVDRLNATRQYGWSATVTVHESISLSTLPDNTLVAIWTSENIGAADTSYGGLYSNRSHIKCVGFLQQDSGQFDANTNTVTFDIASPLQVLQELPAYPRLLRETHDVNNWGDFASGELSLKRAIIYNLRYYTTYLDIFEVNCDGLTDTNWKGLSIDGGNPIGQASDLIAFHAQITCDKTGVLQIWDMLELQDVGNRSDDTVTYTISADDPYISMRYQRPHRPRVQRLRGQGFNTSQAAIFSDYPGTTPGSGSQNTQVTKFIVSNQTELNRLTGHWGAKHDNVYIDSNGERHILDNLVLEVPLHYAWSFDFYAEWIKFTGASTNRRGLDFSTWRYLLQSISPSIRNGSGTATITLKAETSGKAANTFTPPTAAALNLPDFTLPDFIVPFGFVPDLDTDTDDGVTDLRNQHNQGSNDNLDAFIEKDEDIGDTFPSVGDTFNDGGVNDALCLACELWVQTVVGYHTQLRELIDNAFVTTIEDYNNIITGFTGSYNYLGITAVDETTLTSVTASALRDVLNETPTKDALINAACTMYSSLAGANNTSTNFANSLSSWTTSTTEEATTKTIVDACNGVNVSSDTYTAIYVNWLAFNALLSSLIDGNATGNCQCEEWCYHFDFRTSDGSFVVHPTEDQAAGAWVTGTGWIAQTDFDSGFYHHNVVLQRTFTSVTLTKIVINYLWQFGNTDTATFTAYRLSLDSDAGTEIDAFTYAARPADGLYTEEYEGTWSSDTLNVTIRPYVSTSASVHGNAIIKSMTLYGLGTNPFGSDNC